MNPFSRFAASHKRTPLRAEQPEPKFVEGGVVTLRLYDPIDDWGGSWGVSAKEFVATLDGLPDDTAEIRLLVNSPGGYVWEGLAILNALRAHSAKVTAIVEGIAASAASFIVCGADELEMAPNSELFIHKAWGGCIGNAGDMQKMADDLTHEDRNIASIYAKKAGSDIDTWMAAMAAETWFSADEAVDAGLADRVAGEAAAADVKNRWEPSIVALIGRPTAPAQTSASLPSPSPEGQKGGDSVPEITSDDLALLGLPEDATKEAISAKIAEAMDAATAPPPPPPAPTLPEGVVAVDSARLAQLESDAAAGREARDAQVAAHREQLVVAAIADGRIPPARQQHWLDQLAADPGAEQILAGLAKGLIPLAQLGLGGNGDIESELAEDSKLFGEAEARRMHGQEATR